MKDCKEYCPVLPLLNKVDYHHHYYYYYIIIIIIIIIKGAYTIKSESQSPRISIMSNHTCLKVK